MPIGVALVIFLLTLQKYICPLGKTNIIPLHDLNIKLWLFWLMYFLSSNTGNVSPLTKIFDIQSNVIHHLLVCSYLMREENSNIRFFFSLKTKQKDPLNNFFFDT